VRESRECVGLKGCITRILVDVFGDQGDCADQPASSSSHVDVRVLGASQVHEHVHMSIRAWPVALSAP